MNAGFARPRHYPTGVGSSAPARHVILFVSYVQRLFKGTDLGRFCHTLPGMYDWPSIPPRYSQDISKGKYQSKDPEIGHGIILRIEFIP